MVRVQSTFGRYAIIALGILAFGILGSLYLFRHDSGALRKRPPQQVPTAVAPGLKTEFTDSETSRPTVIVVKASWKDAITSKLREVSNRLPNLEKADVESALRTLPIRRVIKTLVDQEGRICEVSFSEPTDHRERLHALLSPVAASRGKGSFPDGFDLIDEIIINNILKSSLSDPEIDPTTTMLEILGVNDEALGSDESARQVMKAFRWRVAIALRGLPLSSDARTTAEELGSNHPDDILRGAVVGSLMAFKPTNDYVKDWFVTETSERALAAALVELNRRTVVLKATDSGKAKIQIEERDGDQGARCQDDYVTRSAYPVSGSELGGDILALLQQRLRPPHPRPPPVELTSDGRLKPVQQFSKIASDLALAALHLRVDESTVQQIVGVIGRDSDGHLRSLLIGALRFAQDSGGESILHSYSRDEARPFIERNEAMLALSTYRTERTGAFLKQLTQDASPQVRNAASMAYYLCSRDLGIFEYLAERDPDPSVRSAAKARLEIEKK